METRKCNMCEEIKFVENFSKCKTYGYQYSCKKCKSDYQKKNKNKKVDWQRKYRQANQEELKEKRKEYYYSHIEEEKQYRKDWAKRPGSKELKRAVCAKQRAKKLRATPAWADLKAIEEFYRHCPIGYEVDHIVPLQGKLVSGLHVLNNLQYLPASENRKKSNKFEVG